MWPKAGGGLVPRVPGGGGKPKREGAEGPSLRVGAGLALGQILSNIFINDPERGSKQSVNEICRGYYIGRCYEHQ